MTVTDPTLRRVVVTCTDTGEAYARIRRVAPPLTARHVQVLDGIAAGRTHAEIAGVLGIGVETVKAHADAMRRRFGARNRAHLVAQAFRVGVLRREPVAA